MFTWSDEKYKLGLKSVDEQHMELFNIAQDTFDLLNLESGDKYHEIMAVFTKLKNYAEMHFAHEEDLMIQTNYPRFSAHYEIHHQFLEKVEGILHDVNEETDEKVLINILTFAVDWITDHILKDDKYMAEFIILQTQGND